jgi:large conductance mechanosensitive channel
MRWLRGLESFIISGSIFNLAVGVMIGTALKGVVDGLVIDIVTPFIPVSNFMGLTWILPYNHAIVRYGAFINSIIAFIIVVLVAYFLIIRPVSAILTRYHLDDEIKYD